MKRNYENTIRVSNICILTNVKTDSVELLDIYRRKEVVENCFDDLKNRPDMRRLRTHSSTA